jgi:hypothetical protein
MSKEPPNFRQIQHTNCNRCIYLKWLKGHYRCSANDLYVLDKLYNIGDVVCDGFKDVEDE